jgi:hypothetical protein
MVHCTGLLDWIMELAREVTNEDQHQSRGVDVSKERFIPTIQLIACSIVTCSIAMVLLSYRQQSSRYTAFRQWHTAIDGILRLALCGER